MDMFKTTRRLISLGFHKEKEVCHKAMYILSCEKRPSCVTLMNLEPRKQSYQHQTDGLFFIPLYTVSCPFIVLVHVFYIVSRLDVVHVINEPGFPCCFIIVGALGRG